MAIAVVLGIVVDIVVVVADDLHCIGVLLLRECIIKILRWFGDDTLLGIDLVLDRSRSSWGGGGGSSRLATILHLLHHFLLD